MAPCTGVRPFTTSTIEPAENGLCVLTGTPAPLSVMDATVQANAVVALSWGGASGGVFAVGTQLIFVH